MSDDGGDGFHVSTSDTSSEALALTHRFEERERGQVSTYELELLANIEEFGWQGTRVADADGDEPFWNYSTGFWLNIGKPEVIVVALPDEAAHAILWGIYDGWSSGALTDETLTGVPGVLDGFDAVFVPVDEQWTDFLGSTSWFYEDDYPALQVVWPDPEGRFPWESGYASAVQPILASVEVAAELGISPTTPALRRLVDAEPVESPFFERLGR